MACQPSSADFCGYARRIYPQKSGLADKTSQNSPKPQFAVAAKPQKSTYPGKEPRSRGSWLGNVTDEKTSSAHVQLSSIPAQAERTGPCTGRSPRSPAHPRVGGANSVILRGKYPSRQHRKFDSHSSIRHRARSGSSSTPHTYPRKAAMSAAATLLCNSLSPVRGISA